MKSTELMIGDWVQIVEDAPTMSCECHQIDWIRTGELGFDNRKVVTYPYTEPIPLTGEILEKNGFKRSEVFEEWKYEDDDVYMIYKPFPHLKIEMEECIVAFPCEYVHELQHALRLCGIDKEIIMPNTQEL